MENLVEQRKSRKQRAAYLDDIADAEVMPDYVKNPLTQRPCKVGGPLYRQLCKKGVLHDPLINQERKTKGTKIVKTNLIEKAEAKKYGLPIPEPSRPQKIVRRNYTKNVKEESSGEESSESEESSSLDEDTFKMMYKAFMKKKDDDKKYVGDSDSFDEVE